MTSVLGNTEMVNITLFSVFLTSAVSLFLTILLLFSENKYKSFIAFNAILAFWSLVYALSLITPSPDGALQYSRFSWFLVVIIAYLGFNFCIDLSRYKVHTGIKNANAIAAFILAAAMLIPSVVITDTRSFLGFDYIPRVTSIFYVFLAYYASAVSYALFTLYKSTKIEPRNKLVFYFIAAGFLGGASTAFLPLGIPVYPLGVFLIPIYVCVTAYAILIDRLFDLLTALSKGVARILALLTVGVMFVVLAYEYNIIMGNREDSIIIVISISIGILVLSELFPFIVRVYENLCQKIIDKIDKKNARKQSLDDQKHGFYDAINLPGLWKMIQEVFNKEIGAKVATLYITDEFYPSAKKGKEKVSYFGEELDEAYLAKLLENPPRKFFEYRDVEFQSFEEFEDSDDFIYSQSLRDLFYSSKTAGYIPFVSGNKVLSFILIKEKDLGLRFNYSDKKLFDDMSKKLGSVLEVLRLHAENDENLEAQAKSIAHEMRGPLNALSLESSNLTTSILDKIESSTIVSANGGRAVEFSPDEVLGIKKSQQLTGDIVEGAEKIITVTLKDVKRKGINISEFQRIRASEIIIKAVEQYGYTSNEQKLAIKTDIKHDFIFKGDEARFKGIINNLLKNPFDFAKQNPSLRIAITISTGQEGQFNKIYVKDNGPGISKERIAGIFGNYATSGKVGGTGVGLPFCKRNMLAFGGDIICESELGSWTQFTLLFPKVSDKEIQAISNSNQNSGSDINTSSTEGSDSIDINVDTAESDKILAAINKSFQATNYTSDAVTESIKAVGTDFSTNSFLIIEDNTAVSIASANAAKRILKGKIDLALSIKEAEAKLCKNSYDVVLADLKMEEDANAGYKIAKKIRTHAQILAKNKHTILICTSGDIDGSDTDEKLIADCKEAGFNDILGKISPKNLLPMIEKWLKK